jgi:glycine/D-amino acid oxidase-like deaminating enzyme
MSDTLPTQAQIVVIGGGIIGCSTAYHLAKNHKADVILLERGKLTCGSTFHAAGLVGQLRGSASITRVLKYSVELYDTLEQETGLATGWKRNGGLRLACNEERWIEIKRQATTAHSFGLEMHLLTPSEAHALWPLMEVSDLVGAAFLPTDGQANPSDITQSLAKGGAHAWCAHLRGRDGHRHHGGRRKGCRRLDDRRRHRLREGRELRGSVGEGGGPAGRRLGAAAVGPAPVHGHRADRRRNA